MDLGPWTQVHGPRTRGPGSLTSRLSQPTPTHEPRPMEPRLSTLAHGPTSGDLGPTWPRRPWT
eukprot:4021936-Pyramimonas_sp.AAC.1